LSTSLTTVSTFILMFLFRFLGILTVTILSMVFVCPHSFTIRFD
jgi:hypothetical protein